MQNRAIVQTIETADQAAQRRLFLRSKYAEHFPVGKRQAAEIRRRADFLAREGVPDAAALADKIDELAASKGGNANFLDAAELLPDDPRAVRAFARILGSLHVPEVGLAAAAAVFDVQARAPGGHRSNFDEAHLSLIATEGSPFAPQSMAIGGVDFRRQEDLCDSRRHA